MGNVNVLDFVARQLEAGILTVSCLSAYIAAEKAADKLGINTTPREAAQLAVLLPLTQPERIREEFGELTADIFDALRPNDPYLTGSLNAIILSNAITLYTRSGNDRERRDAAIVAFAAEAAMASPEDHETLRGDLEDMSGMETDEPRRAFLNQLQAKLQPPEQTSGKREHKGPVRLLSISMDVGGSTEAKARMKECARDEQELTRWYEKYYRDFLSREWRLYSDLFRATANEINWDWKKTFVVKGIGDEIWLLYELGEEDPRTLGALFRRFLRTAQDGASTPIYWTSARDEKEAGDRPSESKSLPLKFYIDIIEDAIEINHIRRDFMKQQLPNLGSTDNQSDKDLVELGNRLHAGHLMQDGRRLVASYRTDYIGWEVDRFFRTTKFALPGIVTVGQTLFKKVIGTSRDPEKNLGGTSLNRMVVEYTTPQGRGRRSDGCFFYVTKNINPEDLKGVGEEYAVYHVIWKHNLLGLHQDGDAINNPDMGETREVFTEEMEAAVRAQAPK